ncbi:hypothetical protein H8B13_18235 [Hymenobacter sp. BT188]|uniref:hypothetical protein n=1 Tax=Hymenobacter sp. BT188 TaxID=2763504 RepID=UPI001650DFAB|nr:hypothetical protein [Hymenobacter sp. BT188]MBC6608773.1 hypothetical protein [Hymenobacter sp. BT188]
MSPKPTSIPQHPVLKPAEDFFRLRREGIGFIEQMGSRQWTDYNVHDPGITMLEALCYALTDLAYRLGWDIQDLLAPASPSPDPKQPFPDQSFFTARDILTINPCTPDDFRRLLIDLEPVRNAWLWCKECACDVPYYAWCEDDKLQLSFHQPLNQRLTPQTVAVRGLYEVLLELEEDPELGDLNDRKIDYTYAVFDSEGQRHPVTVEVRFPQWKLEKRKEWDLFLASHDAFSEQNGASFHLTLTKFNRNKTDNTPLTDAQLRTQWRNVFYTSWELELQPGGEKIRIENAALRFFGDTTAKNQTAVSDVAALLTDKKATGFVQRYRHKLLKVAQAVSAAKAVLHAHRNLNEDYCRVQGVEIEDVAVCADVEVAPNADIERVQAQIWLALTQYFNPPVPFHRLPELLEEGIPVEEIFNGPALNNGFIRAEDLEKAQLKSVLRTSDIINRLMDIEGVRAVNNLLLTKYDAEGNPARGAADPTWVNGQPVFDPTKISASWLLYISALHQPRLYFNLSRFLFYKSGLPFLPRLDEARDTLTQLRGEADRPKLKNALQDLPVPAGTFRHPEDYFPIQHTFPLTYGIGPAGLPSHVGPPRRAQAKQLKAYLLVFEQLLGNALAQVAHTADLFSLNPAVQRTYFVRQFTDSVLAGYSELIDGLDQAALEDMTETRAEFLARRNRFLDHLLARFGEQFSEYTLLLTSLQGQEVGRARLIDDKLAFLKAYPLISHDRGKAFSYRQAPCAPDNIAGLQRRINLLLGYPDLAFSGTLTGAAPGPFTLTDFHLQDPHNQLWLTGTINHSGPTAEGATQGAFREILKQMIQPNAYDIIAEAEQFRLTLQDKNGNPLGQHPDLLPTKAAAQALRDELLTWSSHARALVVEHVLLRPKFPGDALYPACSDGACTTCGEEDPYSFRLTLVLPGWTAPFSTNLELRQFANRTIQQETPAHLLGKTCWVGNDGFIEDPCDAVVNELTNLLINKGLTAEGARPSEAEACACALALYAAFSDVFRRWYADKTLTYWQRDALAAQLKAEFSANLSPADFTCTTVLTDALWGEVQAVLGGYFEQTALTGWQFERFEDAWCAWLTANAAFDWTEERLQERVEAILRAGVASYPTSAPSPGEALCACAATIVAQYGGAFSDWMEANITAGRAFSDFSAFTPEPVTLCSGFTFHAASDTAAALEALLQERYGAYREVSYRLRVVVNLLSQLRNTYPSATLHDCDDGSDQNPVRLGSTALGNSP